jgi:RHS repeat-associated protein
LKAEWCIELKEQRKLSDNSSDPYQFAGSSGYRNDGDVGLTYVGARYYDAQVGRFITRDTYLDQKPYLYCEHEPVNRLDPSGHSPGAPGPHCRNTTEDIVLDFDFNHDDWRQIARGVRAIADIEMNIGRLPGSAGLGASYDKWKTPVWSDWGEIEPGFYGPKPIPWVGVIGFTFGGLTIGGAIAKFIVAPIIDRL